MAIIECPQGHLYDPGIYPSCPYCGGNSTVIDFSRPSNRTAAPTGYGSGVNKTVAPESYRKKQEQENKTVGVFRRSFNDIEPVVGWLACASGPEKGKSYELYAKINTIGRSSENDVCIKGDATISRKSHARLAYDPRHNDFRLIPDESTNNIYLHDEPVYAPARLAAYDMVEVGECRLVFVPLCCDRFQWETTT